MAVPNDEEGGYSDRSSEETLGLDSVAGRLLSVRDRIRREVPVEPSNVVDLSIVEDLPEIDAEPEPERESEPPSGYFVDAPAEPAPAAAPPVLAEPTFAPRPSRLQSFRTWWRQESAARAEEKRARAAAEAAMRARAMQTLAPAAEAERNRQVVRGLLELNEERFQSLGIRSDRLHDELVGISTTLADLRGLVESGGSPRRVVGPATEAIGELQERFDALLGALSEEFDRRSLETERRISEQIVMQSAELAVLLESGVGRIRSAIPEEIEKLRAVIPEEIEKLRMTIPEEMERLRATIPDELDKLRSTIPEEIDRLRDTIPEEIDRLLASIPEEIDRLRSTIPEEIDRRLASIPEEIEKLRDTIPEAIERAAAAMPAPIVMPAAPAPTPTASSEEVPAEAPAAVLDEAAFDRKLTELLVAMNRNTDRLADTLHRGMFELEQEIIRRRPRLDDE